ncbi:MAG: hypothetical protein WBF17_01990 [Phycisphaerae bacterium]
MKNAPREFVWSLVALVLPVASGGAAETITIALAKPELAGISGLRVLWDHPVVLSEDGATEPMERGNQLQAPAAVWGGEWGWHRHLNYWHVDKRRAERRSQPGPIVFDAVHRRLLVRFPDAAERIAAQLARGWVVSKAELILPFAGTEKLARGYKEPTSFIRDIWDKHAPRWHAVAWALRKPWTADAKIGPTFNAYINGAGYWRKHCAQDTTHDRYPRQFGPAEVSAERSEAIDITAMLTDAAFGKSVGERLRGLADCGLIVRKWQVYDYRFATPGYEWATMTGSRGIFVKTPKLLVTLTKGAAKPMQAPPAGVDVRSLAQRLRNSGAGGRPTAQTPSEAELAELRRTCGFHKPAWMPAWQWKRVGDLYGLGGRANVFPETMEDYHKWIDALLATQPRRWEGFSAADQLTVYYSFAKAVPEPVVDHMKLYWTAWLMPHRRTRDCVHNQHHQIYAKWRAVGDDYFDRTGDWRGNASFYRAGYTRMISTMNFNHTAAVGALLGGRLIDSEHALADGRYGLEHFPLRLWAWYDGTTQESIDHYYLAHTLTAQKMFADFAPTRFDRMMGESILLKSIEELAACYHPNLRRFVSTSSRSTPGYVLQVQDGLQHIMHTLSPSGALTDLDRIDGRERQVRSGELNRLRIIGHDLSPRRVAMQAVTSAWAPQWMANVVDRKKLPFEMIATFRQWGAYRKVPKWKKSYLANHYGLASFDLLTPTINLMALWRRTAGEVTSAEQLGLLTCRYGFNRTNMLDTKKGGTLGVMGGSTAVLQHRNKMIVLASPHEKLQSQHFRPEKTDIQSLQTTIALLTVRREPTWEVRVDGRRVAKLPARAGGGSRITVRDGVSYVGIVPIRATDLGRDVEVMLKPGGEPVRMQSGGMMSEGLLIENYNFRADRPLDEGEADWDKIDAAFGGFIVEMGDATEYEDFDAFEKHMARASLGQRWESAGKTLHVTYASGGDKMELGYRPAQKDAPGERVSPERYFPYRRVNGKWPYLPDGIERATPLSVQGRAGRLTKNGATLVVEPGRMGYLLTEPVSGTYVAANPLPDATEFQFDVPGGWTIAADGKLSLARITARPKENRLWVDYAVRGDQVGGDMATGLIVSGVKAAPELVLNGEAMPDAAAMATVDGRRAAIVPLRAGMPKADLAGVPARYEAAAGARAQALAGTRREGATLQFEAGQEHYLPTRPRSGTWAFQRLWPSGTVFRATTPAGLSAASDGRVALLALELSPRENRIEVTAPR